MKKNSRRSGANSKSAGALIAVLVLLYLLGRRASGGGSIIMSAIGSVLKITAFGAFLVILLLIALVVLIIVSIVKDNNKKAGSDASSPKDAPKADAKTEAKTSSAAPKASEKEVTLKPEEAAAIKKGRQNLLELRKLATDIQDITVRNGSEEICGLFETTLNILKQKPDRIPNARQCLNYYIPTFAEVLEKFRMLEKNGALTDGINEKLGSYLVDIRSALTKLNSKLFDDDKLDMSVDMQAMTLAFRRDGLLEETDSALDLKL